MADEGRRAARKKSTRVDVALACTVCNARNYKATKRRDQDLLLKKFCKRCGTHTLHRATK